MKHKHYHKLNAGVRLHIYLAHLATISVLYTSMLVAKMLDFALQGSYVGVSEDVYLMSRHSYISHRSLGTTKNAGENLSRLLPKSQNPFCDTSKLS